MKHFFTIARNSMLVFGLSLTASLNAEVICEDNFDAYNAGNLIGQGQWALKGSHAEDPIQVIADQLTYTDYANATTGNSIKLFTATTTGQDAKLPLDQPFVINDDASIYISLLVRVNSVATTTEKPNVTAFVTGLSGSTGNSENGFLLHAIPGSADGKIKFAIGRGEINTKQNNVAITTEEYDINATYLAVIKYTRRAGTSNDEVALYINPTIDAEPTTANALYNGTSGSEITTHGLSGIQLKQHSSFNKVCPDVTIDAIKVSTAWSDIKNTSGGTTQPVVVPVITTTPTQLNIEGEILSNAQPQTHTLKVKATDLKGDINVAITGANAQNVTVTPAIIKQTDIETTGEAEVTITINPANTEGVQTCEVTFTTEGQKAPTKVSVTWAVIKVFDNLAAFVEAGTAAYGSIATEVAVSAVETTADGSYAYIQDDTKAMKVSLSLLDKALASQFTEGAHFTGIILSENTEIFCVNATASTTTGIEPTTLTMADLEAPTPQNVYRLIKLENIKFATTETTFGTKQIAIKSGEKTINVRALPNSDLIGTNIPAEDKVLNITGILTPGMMGTYYIQLRSLKDLELVNTPTAITEVENNLKIWSSDETLYIESDNNGSATIYTPAGHIIANITIKPGLNETTLNKGIYLVKIDNSTAKIAIK